MKLADVDLLSLDHYVVGPPHEMLRVLRREAPVHWHAEPDGGPGFWCLTKYDDVKYVSQNSKLFTSSQTTNIPDPDPLALPILQGIMLNMDPPRHTAYRGLINKGFTPRRVAALEPYARKIAREVVDGVAARGECDFVEDVAALLPMTLICELFGIPAKDRRYCYDLANRLISVDDPEVLTEDPNDVMTETFSFAMKLAALKRSEPGDDLATVLVNGTLDGKPVDDMTFGAFVILLIVAGNETTRTVTSNGMLRLIEHPDQRRLLVEDPSLIPGAIEEMLRYDPAVHHFRRTATEDLELRGVPIARGDKVVMWYAAANRDEGVFDDPESFDVTRRDNPHLSFGIGQHFCLGASLARLQLRVVFEEVLRRIPDMELAAAPRRLRSNFVNGVKEMQVRFTPERG